MSQQILNNKETGLQIRNKINDNFSELYFVTDSLSSISTENFVLTSDSRLSDSRLPNGTAGGDLTGFYPNPSVKNSVYLAGQPTAPTASINTNSTQIATTEFVQLNKGDKFLALSTTTNTMDGDSNKTFVVSSSSLSYTPAQTVTVTHDSENYLYGTVVSYVGHDLTISINSYRGSGTFSYWIINVGGAKITENTLIDCGSY